MAVDHINAKIRDGYVFGLIGTNGAGKSTFLRMACGILKPDEGTIQIDGEDVYENPKVKSRFFYISDDQYFFGNGTPFEMMKSFGITYKAAGENIAGNSTLTGAVNAWMNSSGHRANILNSSFNYTGIGVVSSNKYGKIYVQMFIGK